MKDNVLWLVIAGWLCFLVSLFLPALLFMGKPIAGWFAAYASVASMAEVKADLEWIYLGLVGLSNLLMVASPLLVWRRKRDKCTWCLSVMALATLLVGSIFFYLEGWKGGVLFGYYVWLVSFCLVTAGLFKIKSTTRSSTIG